MGLINRQAIGENLTAELWKDGLLEVSTTDSVPICSEVGIADKGTARVALTTMLGQVGRVLPIVAEGVDF
jgi:hypothetical protein